MSRSLWPREHGAYVQLTAPLIVALVIAPSVAGALLSLGAFATFLAHEPLLVLIGRRGRRAAAEDGERARLRLGICVALAGCAGLAGIALAPAVLPLAAAVQVPAAAVFALSWRGRSHTLHGEILAAIALAGAGAPVAVAGGMANGVAASLWSMWALGFASTVVAVHVVIATHRRRATSRRWLAWGALFAATGLGIAIGSLSSARFAAASPLWLAAFAVAILRPAATRLRVVGIVLAVAAGATALWSILL